MVSLNFVYDNGENQIYEHVEKVEYIGYFDKASISGDELLTYDYPLVSDMHLFAGNKSYKVSHKGLKAIEVEKED